MKNAPPREADPGGSGTLAVAAVFCLVFAGYLLVPALGHMRLTNHMVAEGVETQGVTRVCAKARGHAKVVMVDFNDASGKAWTCGGQMKADCDQPNAKRFVVYDPSNPAQCMIGPMAMFKARATGVIGPVAGAFGFFVTFLLCGYHAVKRRRESQAVKAAS